MVVDDAGIVLVDRHHHSHRGTEKGDIAVRDVADQSTLQHQLPGGFQSAGQTVQCQFHLSSWRLNQNCQSCEKSVEEVPIGCNGRFRKGTLVSAILCAFKRKRNGCLKNENNALGSEAYMKVLSRLKILRMTQGV